MVEVRKNWEQPGHECPLCGHATPMVVRQYTLHTPTSLCQDLMCPRCCTSFSWARHRSKTGEASEEIRINDPEFKPSTALAVIAVVLIAVYAVCVCLKLKGIL